MKIPPPPADPKNLASSSIPPPPNDPNNLSPHTDQPEESGLGQEALHFLAKEGPAPAGAMIGAALGATGGPVVAIGGAAIGGAAGKAYQKIVEYLSKHADPASDTSMGVAKEIGQSGLVQALAEATGQSVGYVAKLSKPFLTKVGAQILRASSGIQTKYGEAILSKPEALRTALDPKTMSQSYRAFEKYANLEGLGERMAREARSLSAPELEKMVLETANRIKASGSNAAKIAENLYKEGGTLSKNATEELPKMLTAQELYQASQAASHLKLAAKYGEPGAARAIESGNIGSAKGMIDDALERILPEYKSLRMANFYSKAKEAFSSILPQNKNLSPNVLRTTAAGSAAAYELSHGKPGKAAIIMGAVSPFAAGAAIRAASSPITAFGVSTAAKLGAQTLEEKLNQ